MKPSTRTMIALALGALPLAACGGSDDGASDPTEMTTGGDLEAAGATGDAVECDAPGETATVEIGDFVFDPTPLSVDVCDSVVWSNVHTQAHTSTANGDISWSTGNLAAGDDSEPIVFDTPGEFAYMCALHPFMQGIIEVT